KARLKTPLVRPAGRRSPLCSKKRRCSSSRSMRVLRVTAQWYASMSIDFVYPRSDPADRGLGGSPQRLRVRFGRARTKNVRVAGVAGGMALHALALKLGEQLPLACRCGLLVVKVGGGFGCRKWGHTALRQCPRLENNGAQFVEALAAVIE